MNKVPDEHTVEFYDNLVTGLAHSIDQLQQQMRTCTIKFLQLKDTTKYSGLLLM